MSSRKSRNASPNQEELKGRIGNCDLLIGHYDIIEMQSKQMIPLFKSTNHNLKYLKLAYGTHLRGRLLRANV